MNGPNGHLHDVITELSLLLIAEETLDSTLRRAAELVVNLLPHCDMAGISMVSPMESEARIGTRVTTSDSARRIAERQHEADDGPCLAAIRTGEAVLVESVADQERWPAYAREAQLEGLVSSYSVPLKLRDRTVGALSLYSLSSSFGLADRAVVEELATHAAITVANALAYQRTQDLVKNLNEALRSREVIGQATGILMERERCSAEAAFEILRSASQTANVKVRDIATRIVQGGTAATPS